MVWTNWGILEVTTEWESRAGCGLKESGLPIPLSPITNGSDCRLRGRPTFFLVYPGYHECQYVHTQSSLDIPQIEFDVMGQSGSGLGNRRKRQGTHVKWKTWSFGFLWFLRPEYSPPNDRSSGNSRGKSSGIASPLRAIGLPMLIIMKIGFRRSPRALAGLGVLGAAISNDRAKNYRHPYLNLGLYPVRYYFSNCMWLDELRMYIDALNIQVATITLSFAVVRQNDRSTSEASYISDLENCHEYQINSLLTLSTVSILLITALFAARPGTAAEQLAGQDRSSLQTIELPGTSTIILSRDSGTSAATKGEAFAASHGERTRGLVVPGRRR